MTNIVRRRIIQSLGAAATLGPLLARPSAAQSSKRDIVIAASAARDRSRSQRLAAT